MSFPSLSLGLNYGAFNAALDFGSGVLDTAIDSENLHREYSAFEDYFKLADQFVYEASELEAEHIDNAQIRDTIISSFVASSKNLRENIATFTDTLGPTHRQDSLRPRTLAKKMSWKNQDLSRHNSLQHQHVTMTTFIASLLIQLSKDQKSSVKALTEEIRVEAKRRTIPDRENNQLPSDVTKAPHITFEKTDDAFRSYANIFEEPVENCGQHSVSQAQGDCLPVSRTATIAVDESVADFPTHLTSVNEFLTDNAERSLPDDLSRVDYYPDTSFEAYSGPQGMSETFLRPDPGFHGLQIKDPIDGSSKVFVVYRPSTERFTPRAVKPFFFVIPGRARKVLDIFDPQSGARQVFEDLASSKVPSANCISGNRQERKVVIRNPLDNSCIDVFNLMEGEKT